MIPFFITHISKDAPNRIQKVLESTFLSEGRLVREFEESLERRLSIPKAVSVNSGTSALHLGLVCGGIDEGDEVILPSQTFIASGLTILQQKAKPVFADINYETGNIDPSSIRSKITDRTKAIMPVHWAGYPCDMIEIQAIADEAGIWVIEDAAHALGAMYNGHAIGSLSRFSAFSFQAIKHITTGDGGLLACSDLEDASTARQKRWFGIDREKSSPSTLGEREYDVNTLGFKYHLNDYSAALGLANLADLDWILARRRQIAAKYRTELAQVGGVTLFELTNDRDSAWWLFSMHVENRMDFIRALSNRGIPASVVHQGIHKNSIFLQKNADLPNQLRFDEDQVSIPIHQGLSDEDVEYIIDAINKGW